MTRRHGRLSSLRMLNAQTNPEFDVINRIKNLNHSAMHDGRMDAMDFSLTLFIFKSIKGRRTRARLAPTS